MLTIKWQHLAKENQIESEVVYEVSTVRVRDYDEHRRPTRVEIMTFGFGSLCIEPHIELHQKVYVVNDGGKTVASYDVASRPADGTN